MTTASSENRLIAPLRFIGCSNRYNYGRAMSSLALFAIVTSLGFFMPTGVSMIGMGTQTAHAASASDKRFRQWVERLWPQARRKGVSRRIFNTAFRGVKPDPDVIRSAHYQPEFVRPIWDYMSTAASDKRISTGQAMLRQNRSLFDRLERRYKVDRHVLVAIWGMESNFGMTKGDKNVIQVDNVAFESSKDFVYRGLEGLPGIPGSKWHAEEFEQTE